MAEPTAEDVARRLQEKRAARLAQQPGVAPVSSTAEDVARRLQEKRAARLAPKPVEPVEPVEVQEAQEPQEVVAPKPQETKKSATPKPQETKKPSTPKPRTLDEKVAADEAAYDASPEGREKIRARFGAGKPLLVKETARELAARRDDLPDALTEEVHLQREGLKDVKGTLSHLGEQGVNVARVAAADTALQKMRDPRVVGAAAVSPALEPARAAVRQELADAERDFAAASERAEAEALARAESEKVTPPPGDLDDARRLVETLRMETATRKDGKGPSLAKLYVDKRVIELENEKRVDLEKDPVKVAEVRKHAQEQALSELAALNTEGYAIPIGRDVLFDSDSAWWALAPARTVLPGGKVARGESLPGWFLNVVLGAPDYAATTIAEAMAEDKGPTLDDLVKNVGDRRDMLMYAIEQDPELQADIASGDPRRVNKAIATLSPIAVLELATPDAFTALKVAKLPGGAMKAARVAREAAALLRTEEKLSPILALQRAAFKVEKAEEATRAAKKAAKVAEKNQKTMGALADAVERGDALDTLPEAAAVRIRDDVAARLSVDPEAQAFLDATGAAGRLLTPEVVDLPHHLRIDDPLLEVVERGRAKYTAALAEAEKAARADFVKQARLTPDESFVTEVVDVGADMERKAALAAEEEKLAKARAIPDDNARLVESRAVAKEAKEIADGTHPVLQKMRKAADAVVEPFEVPPFLRKERVRIEKALAKLDAEDAALAPPPNTAPPNTALQRQREALAADQAILDSNRGLGAEARARRQAVLDKRAAGLERQAAAPAPAPPPAKKPATAARRAKLDADMKAYLAQEAYLRKAHDAEHGSRLDALRAARDEAREVVARVEADQARLGAPGKQKVKKPDAAKIAEIEQRIAGLQTTPTRELFAARTFEALVNEIAQINRDLDRARTMSPASLRWRVRRLASTLVENIVDYLHPASDLEHRSLRTLWRTTVQDFEGELKEINERLAAAFADVKLGKEDWNAGARTVLEDYAQPFRESIRGGGVDGAYLGAAATAYLRDPVLLDANSLRLLTDAVVRWAREGTGDLDALRAALRERSAGTKFVLRAPQEGDVMLANAVSSQGAVHALLVSADARGLTLGKEAAQAANTYLDNLSGIGPVGGRAQASRGRQVMANLLVPEDYRAPLTAKELRGRNPEHVKTPIVPARTEQARGLKQTKAAMQEQKLREAAVASMGEVMEGTEEVLGKNVFVPRAVRDVLAKQVDAVLATARIQDEGGTLILRNFWKQAAVLGVLTSRPNQTVMDFWSDVLAVNARLGPISAAKVAGRSVVAQFLATFAVAQVSQVVDAAAPLVGKALDKAGIKGRFVEVLKDAKSGSTARGFIQRLSLTPEIDAIFNRDPAVKIGKYTAQELHDIGRAGKVFESFSAGQLTRTMQEAAYLIFGDTPFGKAKALYFENQRALQDLANLSATRRRLAIYYGLVEVGHDPHDAARISVEIAGDFAGELHPIERGWFSTVFPFWAYRKFNARRTMYSLTTPFWLTRGRDVQEGIAATLSWYLDDSDEYGFHTASMHEEPDAEALDELRAQVHEEHPELDMASAEAEAIVAERADELPRAIERYNRLVAKLRALPYDEAKKVWRTDPEWTWLVPYHAEDPVRGMVPAYAQDRYAVFVQENRSQAVESWYRRGVGRFEKGGNVQRYWLMPNDPHIDGLTEVAALTAIGSVLGASLVQDDVGFGVYNRSNLLDGFLRDPMMSTLFGVGSNITAEERQYGKTVPDWMGEILANRGLARLDTEQDRGEDVTAAPETKRGARYVIPPEVLNAAALMPLVAPVLFGALELAITGQRISGDTGKAGPKDTADVVAAVAEGFTGQKLGTFDPESEAYLAGKRSDRRVQNVLDDLGSQNRLRPPDDVLAVRDVRSAVKSTIAPEEVRLARAKLAARKLLTPLDVGALRGELVRQGLAEDEAIRLSDAQVVAKFSTTR